MSLYFTEHWTWVLLFFQSLSELNRRTKGDQYRARHTGLNKNFRILGVYNKSPPKAQSATVWVDSLPSFHFSEVKGDLSVGHSLLIQVAAVSPDECWHIVAYITKEKQRCDDTCPDRRGVGWEFQALLQNKKNLPWRPLLSKKLLRLNSVFLEARYCINLWKTSRKWGTVWACGSITAWSDRRSHLQTMLAR